MHMMVGFDMEAANDANDGNQSHERLMQISGFHYIQILDCLLLPLCINRRRWAFTSDEYDACLSFH